MIASPIDVMSFIIFCAVLARVHTECACLPAGARFPYWDKIIPLKYEFGEILAGSFKIIPDTWVSPC